MLFLLKNGIPAETGKAVAWAVRAVNTIMFNESAVVGVLHLPFRFELTQEGRLKTKLAQ